MPLETIEVETAKSPDASVIWLHGLGADGHDFEPIVPEVVAPDQRVRFIFPHAPVRPVTINGGVRMRAWYDIIALDRSAEQDEAGIRQSQGLIEELIAQEKARGIPSQRIVLAGFSQGGALALHTALRHPETLGGIVGLSCYLLLESAVADEAVTANRETPIFMAHGVLDPMVLPAFGEHTKTYLETLGYQIEWRTYMMGHAVCPEEIGEIRRWLSAILGDR